MPNRFDEGEGIRHWGGGAWEFTGLTPSSPGRLGELAGVNALPDNVHNTLPLRLPDKVGRYTDCNCLLLLLEFYHGNNE